MNLNKIFALSLRHVYLIKGSFPRILDLIYWPTIQIFLWGFISKFFTLNSSYFENTVGIAEQHAVTFAAGLATEGYKPYAAIYSTFLQRAYDQVVHDVALQSLPVRFAIDRAGLVGADGPTHAGSFDITYLSLESFFATAIPNVEEIDVEL